MKKNKKLIIGITCLFSIAVLGIGGGVGYANYKSVTDIGSGPKKDIPATIIEGGSSDLELSKNVTKMDILKKGRSLSNKEIEAPKFKIEQNNIAITKDEITTKMLNVSKMIGSISGNLNYVNSTKPEENYDTHFNFTNEKYVKFYEETTFEAPQKRSLKSDNPDKIVMVYDGETKKMESLTIVGEKLELESIEIPTESAPKPLNKIARNNKLDSMETRVTVAEDGEPLYRLSENFQFMSYSQNVLSPDLLVLGLLQDKDMWDVTGQEKLNGIDSLVIAGKLDELYSQRFGATTFVMNIEPHTGLLIKFTILDNSGKITRSMETEDLNFDVGFTENDFSISQALD